MEWNEIRRPGGGYFAAANSADGFVSFYRECILKDADRIFLIKGGPGTGKSRLLAEVAGAAAGDGWNVGRFFCSSDPDSLDGIRLTDGQTVIALVDATPPHALEPECPGAREGLLDLGAFWDPLSLQRAGKEIGRLAAEKAGYYRAAYGYLAACGRVARVREETLRAGFRTDKAAGCVGKILRETEDVTKSRARSQRHGGARSAVLTRTVLTSAVSMKGYVKLDTLLHRATHVCLVDEGTVPGCGILFLALLADLSGEWGIPHTVALDPILPDRPESLYFPQSGLLFTTDSGDVPPDRALRMSRFLDPAALRLTRHDLRTAEKLRRGLLARAGESLAHAAESHFGLEVIYRSAMDFGAKERFTAAFIETVKQQYFRKR